MNKNRFLSGLVLFALSVAVLLAGIFCIADRYWAACFKVAALNLAGFAMTDLAIALVPWRKWFAGLTWAGVKTAARRAAMVPLCLGLVALALPTLLFSTFLALYVSVFGRLAKRMGHVKGEGIAGAVAGALSAGARFAWA